METQANSKYLVCEQKLVYALLMMSAGMMGAYTYVLRGGVFCNAQTANFVMMSIAFGQGKWFDGFYFFVPISAYLAGSVISEILPSPIKKLRFLRWDTILVIVEIFTLFAIGFIPLSVPDQVVQIIVNFIASMQYNTFRQAEGIPMATTFCTNHVRQVGVAFAKMIRKKDTQAAKRGLIHLSMLLAFFGGGLILTFFCKFLQEKSIWVALVPMFVVLAKLIYADVIKEHGMLERKPSGH